MRSYVRMKRLIATVTPPAARRDVVLTHGEGALPATLAVVSDAGGFSKEQVRAAAAAAAAPGERRRRPLRA